MRRFLSVALVFALVTALAGCGSKPAGQTAQPKQDEPVTLTFWHTYNTDGPETKTLNEVVIPAFEAKHPNIKVKAQVMPYDGLHDNLVTAVSGGAVPDVMRMDIIWTPEFAKLGALTQMDNLAGFGDLKGQVFAGPLSTNFYKGHYYGLPLDTNTQVAIYNRDLLKAANVVEPPKTLDELKALAEKFKGQKDKWGFALGGPGPWQTLPIFWSAGGRVTDEQFTKASGYLNSDASVKALQWIIDMKYAGLMGPSLTGGKPDPWGGFKGGNYASIIDGPWFFAIMGKDLGDKMVGAPIPAGPGGSTSVVGGENVVIFKTSKHQEAAWEFVKYLLSDEAQTAMAKVGQMPVTQSASNSDVMKSVAYYAPYVTQLATAKPRTVSPNWPKIEKVLSDSFEAAIRGKSTAKAALDDAARQIDALLAQ
ncbi:MAG: extracellular solute-binding protein [Bacillota bacterium]